MTVARTKRPSQLLLGNGSGQMTIAFLSRFPFGMMGQLAQKLAVTPKPGLALATGIVFATDSRFSSDGAAPEDDGAKIWQLSAAVGAVLCGSVEPAERALSATKRQLRSIPDATFSDHLRLLEDYLRRNWPASKPLVRVAVGGGDSDGTLRVALLSSDDSFVPHGFDHAGVVIGDPSTFADFRQRLNELLPEAGVNQWIDADSWMWRVAAAMRLTTDVGHLSIGGRIQVAKLDSNGWWEQEPTEETSGPGWDLVTVAPRQQRTASGRDREHRASGSEVHHLD